MITKLCNSMSIYSLSYKSIIFKERPRFVILKHRRVKILALFKENSLNRITNHTFITS